MRYLHWIKIATQVGGTPGTQDPDTGVWTPGAGPSEQVVYEGEADVQDSGRAIVRSEGAPPTLSADAIVFLKDEQSIVDVRPGQTVTIADRRSGRQRDAEVASVTEMEGSFLARFL